MPSDDIEDPETLPARVGRRIAELRERAGVTQAYMAGVLETNVSNYQRIENGEQNLTLRTMARIAVAVGVNTIELLKAPEHPLPKRRPRGRPKKSTR